MSSNAYIQTEADRLQVGPALVSQERTDLGQVVRLDPPRPHSGAYSRPLEFVITRRCGCGSCTETFQTYVPADKGGNPSRQGRPQIFADGHKGQGYTIRKDLGTRFMRSRFDSEGPPAMEQLEALLRATEGIDLAELAGVAEAIAEAKRLRPDEDETGLRALEALNHEEGLHRGLAKGKRLGREEAEATARCDGVTKSGPNSVDC